MKKGRNALRWVMIIAAFLAFAPGTGGAVGGLNLPPVKAFQLDNGAKVFYVLDDLPQVTVVASIGFGRLYEKKGTAGLSDLLAKTLSLAGSDKYPGMKLHEKIDSMGGVLTIASSFERMTVSLSVLPRFREDAFAIVSDILAHPNFDEGHFAMARALVADEIRRKYDDPFDIAFDRAMEHIFNGDGYGANPSEEKIASYVIKDVRDAWRAYFGAKNILIAVATSEPFDQIRDASKKYFSSMEPGATMDYAVDAAALAERIKASDKKIFLYPKELQQSSIVVGTIGPAIKSPGNFALVLMNFILGEGSFNSRLMREIRVKRGMAYSVASIMRFRKNTGVFLAFAQTKNENAATVLSLLRENVKIMADEPIPAKELDWAKKSLENRFIFKFETPMDVLGSYLDREYYGLPANYYDTYLDNLKGVTGTGIVKESGKIFGGGFVTCVVGSEKLKETLKSLGEVVVIDEK